MDDLKFLQIISENSVWKVTGYALVRVTKYFLCSLLSMTKFHFHKCNTEIVVPSMTKSSKLSTLDGKKKKHFHDI